MGDREQIKKKLAMEKNSKKTGGGGRRAGEKDKRAQLSTIAAPYWDKLV